MLSCEIMVDPFCVQASVMALNRSKYLTEDSIAILPQKICINSSNKPYSKSAIQWLEFSFQSGEKIIVDNDLGSTYYVDGLCKETNTVFFNS